MDPSYVDFVSRLEIVNGKEVIVKGYYKEIGGRPVFQRKPEPLRDLENIVVKMDIDQVSFRDLHLEKIYDVWRGSLNWYIAESMKLWVAKRIDEVAMLLAGIEDYGFNEIVLDTTSFTLKPKRWLVPRSKERGDASDEEEDDGKFKEIVHPESDDEGENTF